MNQEPQIPAGYRQVQQGDLTPAIAPYRQQAWLWVYYYDPQTRRGWQVTGSGVFIDDDVILTCAHIFALNAPLGQTVYVSAHPAYNSLETGDKEPPGGLYADSVFACPRAFPANRQLDEFDPTWDLALVCLSTPATRNAPPFIVSGYPELGYDPAFQGAGSQLKTVGYGGPSGVMIEANLPMLEAQPDRHWLEVDRQMMPGQSGAPIFYEATDQFKRTEYRLVGVVSCDDKKAPMQSIGPMITKATEDWITRALGEWSQRKRQRTTRFSTVD